MQVRREVNGKTSPATVRMTFGGDLELHIHDDGGLMRDYSDITITAEGGRYYGSVDPYGNSGVRDERDNYVMIADDVEIEELEPSNKAV